MGAAPLIACLTTCVTLGGFHNICGIMTAGVDELSGNICGDNRFSKRNLAVALDVVGGFSFAPRPTCHTIRPKTKLITEVSCTDHPVLCRCNSFINRKIRHPKSTETTLGFGTDVSANICKNVYNHIRSIDVYHRQ